MLQDYISLAEALEQTGLTRLGLCQRIKRGSVRGDKVGWIVHKDDLKDLKPNKKTEKK